MIKLFNGDCLDVMKDIEDRSIDLIVCDLPYGVTQAKHDCKIPLDELWKEYDRILKENGVVLLFGQGMFTAELMLSSPKWKYNLVWNKVLSSGFLNAKIQPLRQHEDICVFYDKKPTYNPQFHKGKPNHTRGKKKPITNNNYGEMGFKEVNKDGMKYPTDILTFRKPHPSVSKHPTEKPVELLEYLIKTYSNEGDLVLDNCMGAGSTLEACLKTDRNGIGIEKEKKFYDIAEERINNFSQQIKMDI